MKFDVTTDSAEGKMWLNNLFLWIVYKYMSILGRLINNGNHSDPKDKNVLDVQCYPLYSILLALGNPVIHYFSLDIEGAELPVLRVRNTE